MSHTETSKEIGLDLAHCSCCQGCVEINPDIFEWDDNNDMPHLLKDKATEEELQEIMACCPKDCIYLLE
ncbi:MAG: ferredoxin [Proteobacteria bacterium]|nr:ferredoxin [Pseudomonadota bacterium]